MPGDEGSIGKPQSEFVVNISFYLLTELQVYSLSKGLSFCPIYKTNSFQLDLETMLEILFFFKTGMTHWRLLMLIIIDFN